MTTIGDIIFAIVWFGALICGIALMANGWSLMSDKSNKREWKESHENLPKKMSQEIEGSTHPEMQEVKPGDELIVVRFQKDNPDKDRFKLDSPVLHGEDPLHKSLQDRIKKLKDESKNDEDDDDGGAGVVLSR